MDGRVKPDHDERRKSWMAAFAAMTEGGEGVDGRVDGPIKSGHDHDERRKSWMAAFAAMTEGG